MEAEYRREMNRNYMVIRPQETWNEKYVTRMLSGNKIRGLLAFQDKMLDGEVKYYYDITSKQPLNRVLEHRNLSGEELRTLIRELLYTLKQLERYFLDESQLCLAPEFIYVEPGSFKASFCLVPGIQKAFHVEFCELSQYLLDHVDQSDGEAVVLAFSIFRECRKLNFGIEDIERCLRQQDKAQGEDEKQVSDLPVKKERAQTIADEIERNEYKEDGPNSNKRKQTIPGMIVAVGGIGLMILVPFFMFLIGGAEFLLRIKWVLLIGEILAAVIWFLLIRFLTKTGTENIGENDPILDDDIEDESDEEPWEVYFREENEEKENAGNVSFHRKEKNTEDYSESVKNEKEEDDFQTVLLNARPICKESRKLVPVNGDGEISIPYFPFLIGKSKDLTDFRLNKPGVSRLHVKIEETDDGYSITDLNSTNGTMINGTLLEANGSAPLTPGDEVTIAAERFYFR